MDLEKNESNRQFVEKISLGEHDPDGTPAHKSLKETEWTRPFPSDNLGGLAGGGELRSPFSDFGYRVDRRRLAAQDRRGKSK